MKTEISFEAISFLLGQRLYEQQKNIKPQALLGSILFRDWSLNESDIVNGTDFRIGKSHRSFPYLDVFNENMGRIRSLIDKGKITVEDFYKVCFTNTNLYEVLASNGYLLAIPKR